MPDMHCALCGKKIKKLREGAKSPYANFFCSTKCHVAYTDQVLDIIHEAESEAVTELEAKDTNIWSDFLKTLDSAAAESVSGRRPEDVTALFISKMAGKLAPKLYLQFREWIGKRKIDSVKEQKKKTPEVDDKLRDSSKPTETTQPKQVHTPTQRQAGPIPMAPREPSNLDSLPLVEQRVWLMRRFKGIKADASVQELSIERIRLTKLYHPDNKKTGNPKMMALINSTYDRIRAIDKDLGNEW